MINAYKDQRKWWEKQKFLFQTQKRFFMLIYCCCLIKDVVGTVAFGPTLESVIGAVDGSNFFSSRFYSSPLFWIGMVESPN